MSRAPGSRAAAAFEIGPTTLKISDPLGLFRMERHFPAERSLVILPMIFPISSFLAPPGMVPGGQVIRRKTMDITPHAAGVREYVPGDPMKRIHWPTSARRGSLMVKEFEQDPQAEVWLFLDAQQKVQSAKSYETPAMPLGNLLFSRKPKLSLRALHAGIRDQHRRFARALLHSRAACRRPCDRGPRLYHPGCRAQRAPGKQDTRDARLPRGQGHAVVLRHGRHAGPAACRRAPT